MRLDTILDEKRIRCDTQAASKKRVLETMSHLLLEGNEDALTPLAVFDALVARERLGSTALGFGVALPHARLANATEPVGAFTRLTEGVDFDAPDGTKVDLVFSLLVPEASTEEHLLILSQLAELFNEASLRDQLRNADSPAEVLRLFSNR